ncbi:hypothetical protein AAYQ05_20705 [Flavobacterium sp. B11]|uniref:hypothetical protein n=1 Tax=Flavobacterium movens TaxID=214860 RepID=UPI0031DC34E7
MKKIFTPTTFFIFSLLFLVFAFGLKSYKKGNNIDSKENVENFIKGKWHDETTESGGVVTYYRFEITETEIKCWKSHLIMSNNGVSSDNVTSDWTEQPPVSLSIGSVEIESVNYSNGKTDYKYRLLGNCTYGTYKIWRTSNGDLFIRFKDNNSINSDTECSLKKGWEY